MNKLVFVLPTFNPGGAEHMMIRLANYFSEAFSVHILVLESGGVLASRVSEKVQVHDLKCSRSRYAFLRCRTAIKQLQPDIVFSSIIRLNFLLILVHLSLARSFRLIIRQPVMLSSDLEQAKFPKLSKRLYRALYPLAERVVCQSQAMQKEMLSELPLQPERCIHIYNPRKNHESLKESGALKLFASRKNFVAIGRLEIQKGFDLLIQAFSEVHHRHPDYHLTIIGEGHLRDEFKAKIQALGLVDCVHLPGFIDDVAPYIQNADAVVSSSRFEGLPNVVIEAITLGTPVVASDCPGGTAEIIQDGVNGYLVKDISAEGLADGLCRFIEEPLPASNEDIQNTAAKFDEEKIYAQYQTMFMQGDA